MTQYGVRLHGVKEACSVLKKFQESDLTTLVYVDPDVDGFFAAYFNIILLRELGIKYTYYINTHREHGFLLPIDKIAGKYNVINGDFTITEEQIDKLVKGGSNVLSMDHHDLPESEVLISKESNGVQGVYINNQYCFEPKEWRYLSGAQVVLYTLREVCKDLGMTNSRLFDEENIALGAITLLSDVREIGSKTAREELKVLYESEFSGYLKRMFQGVMTGRNDYSFGVPKFDRNFIDFTFTPSINSLIRLGREVEAFKFILGDSYPTGRKTPQQEQKEFVERIIKSSVSKEFGKLKIIRLDESKFYGEERDILSNFLGLVCSKMGDGGYNTLGYVVKSDGSVNRASFRGIKTGVKYRSNLAAINGVDARGHEIAFGIKNFRPTAKILSEIVKVVNKIESETTEHINVIPMSDLNDFQTLKKIAVENGYLNNEDRVYIQYTGSLAEVVYDGERVKRWNLGGTEVVQFNMGLDIKKDLILPSMNRKTVELILDRKTPIAVK